MDRIRSSLQHNWNNTERGDHRQPSLASRDKTAHHELQADDVILRPKAVVKTDTKLRALLKDWTGTKASRAHDLFLALATCNTIVPIVEHMVNPAAKLVEYHRESPDE
ncbi:phospholipid-transporting ATPase 1-like [Hordeum vulgare]|nr:phospholipid-transporting ATPase 1-like [Hordeum vulgare]